MKTLHIAPNKPAYVSLIDPNGEYDDDLRQGRYQTTTGELLTLPRPAVVELNLLEPRPSEEIQITKHWTGRAGDSVQWTVALNARSEHARAAQEIGQDEAEGLGGSNRTPEPQEPSVAFVTPIRKPSKRQSSPEPQPRLFDSRGTGTHGPAPLAQQIIAVAPAIQTEPAQYVKPQPIPWNVAFREVSAFVSKELKANDLQWSDQSQQDLCSTVLIAASKAGLLGLWERGK